MFYFQNYLESNIFSIATTTLVQNASIHVHCFYILLIKYLQMILLTRN